MAPLGTEVHTVGLRTGAPHGWPLTAIKHPELDCRAIGNDTHHSAKSIYLSDYLPLSYTPNGRITTHLRHLVHIHCN